MDWLQMVISVVVVSVSGALAPGPLLIATISESLKRGARVGIFAACGHMVVELPFVLLIAIGLAQPYLSHPFPRLLLTGSGVVALAVFGAMQVSGAIHWREGPRLKGAPSSRGNGLLLGVIFTGLNPYFIIWWLTVGAPLIYDALQLASWLGIAFMYASHIWIDYAWLYAACMVTARGGAVLGSGLFRAFNAALGAALILMATVMTLDIYPRVFS